MIEAEDLTFSYTGTAPFILHHLQLDMKDGAYISVVGENGCGKSTLMRLILGFLKPTAGSIHCSAKRIGYVPQKTSFVNDDFPITVYEVMESYRRLLKQKDKKEVNACLQKVGMLEKIREPMSSLSGGQGQKVRIARALMGSPKLLILDEPSTGVDVQSQQEIYGLLKKLNMEDGISVLSVEHNLTAAIENSTAIYHMNNGQGHLCTPQHYADEMLTVNKGGN
ncbi:MULTISPECIES: metal ABC transporter ATP-binding protein [Caproicibacterium]|uniref:Metal ABC transporter ATP-binding protein n=1 Tax=Caproicibacterium argilliputei TaxID=3030016 RepID=A0AA97H366_9FIRM|nr:metal ABC transporter ATP-binding protein [Caproicibacterium argilliputei]WOC33510.1 metal ABC transporter ATP-binding protein [Caproicibacterium argilliputei]